LARKIVNPRGQAFLSASVSIKRQSVDYNSKNGTAHRWSTSAKWRSNSCSETVKRNLKEKERTNRRKGQAEKG